MTAAEWLRRAREVERDVAAFPGASLALRAALADLLGDGQTFAAALAVGDVAGSEVGRARGEERAS